MQYRKTVFIWPLYLLCIASLPATDPVSSTGMSLNQDLVSVKLKWNGSLNIFKISLNIWNESLNILNGSLNIEFKLIYCLNLTYIEICLTYLECFVSCLPFASLDHRFPIWPARLLSLPSLCLSCPSFHLSGLPFASLASRLRLLPEVCVSGLPVCLYWISFESLELVLNILIYATLSDFYLSRGDLHSCNANMFGDSRDCWNTVFLHNLTSFPCKLLNIYTLSQIFRQ